MAGKDSRVLGPMISDGKPPGDEGEGERELPKDLVGGGGLRGDRAGIGGDWDVGDTGGESSRRSEESLNSAGGPANPTRRERGTGLASALESASSLVASASICCCILRPQKQGVACELLEYW